MAETLPGKYIPKVRILCGLPASGKTTEATRWVKHEPNRRLRINYDDIRKEMFGDNWNWNRKEEDLVQTKAVEMFENAMRLDMSVIIDNTNLTPRARDAWKDRAIKHGIIPTVDEIGSHESIWDIGKRDLRRGTARVGRAVIERMALFNGFIDWKNKKAYYNHSFVICDLDGTLCDITHRRHFVAGEKKDWKSFFANVKDDALNAPVAELLDTLAADGHHILLVSGRPITPCGIPTEDWLLNHEIAYDHLFMRQGGDHRSDVIVKQEILDHLPKDRIDYVLDDRDSVVKMWRDNGLFCMQVAPGDF